MIPGRETVGRFWMDDATGELWLQEFADSIIVSFIDGYYHPTPSSEHQPPERKVIVANDSEHGLRLLDEPIRETLARETSPPPGDHPATLSPAG